MNGVRSAELRALGHDVSLEPAIGGIERRGGGVADLQMVTAFAAGVASGTAINVMTSLSTAALERLVSAIRKVLCSNAKSGPGTVKEIPIYDGSGRVLRRVSVSDDGAAGGSQT